MRTHRSIPITLMALAILLALPLSVPAPMSPQDMGLPENFDELPAAEQMRLLEEWHRENEETRATVARESAERSLAAHQARSPREALPADRAQLVANARPQGQVSEGSRRGGPGLPAQAESNGIGGLILMVCLVLMAGWGFWLIQRFSRAPGS
ncbi:hypothetical protein JXA47_16230 [Candidatus Sumerlaeota bacterium]|nr:hypothetical protein [Candidatus Sumerlaeota bacterium]